MLWCLTKISFFIGIIIFGVFFIWLTIELKQDKKINKMYEKHRNEKLLVGDKIYECQACGNRQVKNDDTSCRVCGIEFSDKVFISSYKR